MKLPIKDLWFVGIQGILFLCFLWPGPFSFSTPAYISYTLYGLAGIGAMILLIAVLQLNSTLSPFPTPRSSGQLITNGLYAHVRHPIYSGILLLAFGLALATGSFFRLLISLLLLLLFYYKSSYEEKLLEKHYPDYADFKNSRGRFSPKW